MRRRGGWRVILCNGISGMSPVIVVVAQYHYHSDAGDHDYLL